MKLTAADQQKLEDMINSMSASGDEHVAFVIAPLLSRALTHISTLEAELFTEVTHNKEILEAYGAANAKLKQATELLKEVAKSRSLEWQGYEAPMNKTMKGVLTFLKEQST